MWEIYSNREKDVMRDIVVLSGVGEKRAAVFRSAGIETIADVAACLPIRYIHRKCAIPIAEVDVGEVVTVAVVICKSQYFRGTLRIEVEDDSGRARAIFFNTPTYFRNVLVKGREILMWGTAKSDNGNLLFVHPDFEVEGEGEEVFIPVYPNAARFTEAKIGIKTRAKISLAAAKIASRLSDPIPITVLDERELLDFPKAILEIHSPSSWETLESAKRRFAFDELLLLQIVFAIRRFEAKHDGSAIPLRPGRLFGALRDALPFDLTEGQNRALSGILEDITRPGRSSLLLTGDVGSGKTAVALMVAAAAIDSGLQVVVMVPSLLVARQHADLFDSLLGPLGVSVGLLTGGSSSPSLIEKIADGDVDLVVGTQALLSDRIEFHRLGLIIIDEQHRFGVQQRLALPERTGAHVLLLSATPIPRTMALALYGDLERHIIEGAPSFRAGVKTYLRTGDARPDVWNFIERRIELGERAFVVYPRIEGDDLSSAVFGFEGLNERFPGRAALIHGSMSDFDKNRIFASFRSGEKPVLAATSLIEVGIDVPEATVMVIEKPESFGLAQLHQMRGRIGRGKLAGYCILISHENPGSIGRKRLERFASTDDGFRIAEIDLESRGEGEVLMLSQSGRTVFNFAVPSEMKTMTEDARECAIAIVSVDPELIEPRNIGLKNGIEYLLKTKKIVSLSV